MNRYCSAVVIAALCATTALGQVDRGRAARTPTNDPAGLQRASCVLQVDSDERRGGRRFDSQTLNALLTSTSLVDPAAKQALNLGPADWPKVASVELTPAGNSAVRLGVTILPDAKLPPTAAQAFLDALAAAAKASVEKIGGTQAQAAADRVAKLETQLAESQKRLSAATAAMNTARSAATSFEGDPRLGARGMANERATLELTLVGQRARLEALDAEMKRLTPTTPPAPVPAAVPEAVEPAVPGRAFSTPNVAGLSVYDRFEVERITLRCNIAEGKARYEFISNRLNGTAGGTTQPAAADFERLQQEQSVARDAVQMLQGQLQQARQEVQESGAVRLLILDGRQAKN